MSPTAEAVSESDTDNFRPLFDAIKAQDVAKIAKLLVWELDDLLKARTALNRDLHAQLVRAKLLSAVRRQVGIEINGRKADVTVRKLHYVHDLRKFYLVTRPDSRWLAGLSG